MPRDYTSDQTITPRQLSPYGPWVARGNTGELMLWEYRGTKTDTDGSVDMTLSGSDARELEKFISETRLKRR